VLPTIDRASRSPLICPTTGFHIHYLDNGPMGNEKLARFGGSGSEPRCLLMPVEHKQRRRAAARAQTVSSFRVFPIAKTFASRQALDFLGDDVDNCVLDRPTGPNGCVGLVLTLRDCARRASADVG